MKERIEQVKADFLQAKGGILHALAHTPDDRLTWSPSPSARSPLHQVVHAAQSIGHMHGFLDGRPFEVPNTAEADRGFREFEQSIKDRQSAIDLLERSSAAFVAWLDGLDEARFNRSVPTPFGMGEVPVHIGIGFPAMHTRWHHAQIEYIQTIYGDQDWHLPTENIQ